MYLDGCTRKPYGIRTALISIRRTNDNTGTNMGRFFDLDRTALCSEGPLDTTYRSLAKIALALEDTRILPHLYDSQGGPGGGEGSAEGTKTDRKYPLSPALANASTQLNSASHHLRTECGEADLARELYGLSEKISSLAYSDRVKRSDEYPLILEEVEQVLLLLEQRVPQIN